MIYKCNNYYEMYCSKRRTMKIFKCSDFSLEYFAYTKTLNTDILTTNHSTHKTAYYDFNIKNAFYLCL